MFDLHSIILTNFRSYLGTHEFDFPTKHGLYFLSGRNIMSPALGANGAGKSTFLDAISWVLFGRTTRGLKAAEVVSWGATSATVTIELTVGDRRSLIKRTQKPNGLFLDDKPVDQVELQKYLRLNYESFKYSVLNPQFSESFFAMQPTAKLNLFSDIQNLDYWLELSKAAGKQADKFSSKITECTASINHDEGRLTVLKEDIKTLTISTDNYDIDKKERIKKINTQYTRIANDIDNIIAPKISKIKGNIVKAKAELKACDFEMKNWTSTRNSFLDKIAAVSKKRTEILADKKAIRTEKLKVGGCPLCLQEISHKHVESVKHINERMRLELDVQIAIVDDTLQTLTKEMIKAKNGLSRQETLAFEWQDEILKLEKELNKQEVNELRANDQLAALNTQIDLIAAERNPHKEMLNSKKLLVKDLTEGLTEDRNVLEGYEAKYAAISFWVKGFKRVRLFIIEQAFRTLELEVNNVLAQLGMPDWQITFDIERENKSGGVTKGFVVFVKSPGNIAPVKWETWSGGETQRLQLAGDLGLANLIMQGAGLNNKIEFYDEPSTHLSTEGMMDLANTLHERAMEEGKRIWIVDHTSIANFGEFEGIITARKDKNGRSSITIEADSRIN